MPTPSGVLTTSVAFPDKKDLARIKKAASRMGMPFTMFIRQAAKIYADEVLKTGRARAA